jgi:hypothetical protein
MSRSFVPFAERIDLTGYTPDPNNPEIPEIPDIPEPFEPRPEIPDLKRDLFFPCRLRLKQGCYKIRMESTKLPHVIFSPYFAGTMRVEIDDQPTTTSGDLYRPTTISGDLYRFRPLDDLVVQQPRRMSALLANDLDAGSPVIPIYPRRRYYSYLRVVKIQSPLFTSLHRLCTISLTVEEFKYTHPQPGDVTGSFPATPDRTLTIVLHKIPNPQGYAGPSFQGSVFHNGNRLPVNFTILWVSDFFRRAKVELENVTGVPIHSNAAGNDFQTIYGTAGWDLEVVTGDSNLAVPAGVSNNDPWSNAELHQFMTANRNPATDLDKEWRFYHVFVPFDSGESSGLFGIMFDELQDHREGSCNFIQNFSGVHNDDRAKLRSAAHEIGHGFNQLHPPTESLNSDNSIMSQSGAVRSVIESGGGTYPDGINFSFNEHTRHHLIHFPDVVVRPGGEDFQFGHSAGFAPEAADNADAAGLKLEISVSSNRIKLGEPLMLRVELKNNGKESVQVPKNIGTAFHVAEITVNKNGEQPRLFRSFVILCDRQDYVALGPGSSVYSDETIYWDSKGFLFRSPGMYVVNAVVKWEEFRKAFAATAAANVWIDYPVDDRDNHMASLLMNDEVGKYIALGGNATHLKEAVSRLEQATRAGKEHPAIQRILKIDEATKKRPSAKKRPSRIRRGRR